MKNLFSIPSTKKPARTSIENALLAGLISLVCVLAITNAGTKVKGLFENVEASIP